MSGPRPLLIFVVLLDTLGQLAECQTCPTSTDCGDLRLDLQSLKCDVRSLRTQLENVEDEQREVQREVQVDVQREVQREVRQELRRIEQNSCGGDNNCGCPKICRQISPADCKPPFELLRNSAGAPVGCYKILLTNTTWYNAPYVCSTYDPRARLAVVDTAAKNTAIKQRLLSLPASALGSCLAYPNTGIQTAFWTAGVRKVHQDCSSPFYWKPTCGNESPLTYTDWRNLEPNCGSFPGVECCESCMAFWVVGQYTWADIACDRQVCSVCEIPLA